MISTEEKSLNNSILYNNKYYKIEKCGAGAFGKVFKTSDIKDENKFYAVKLKIDKTNIIQRQIEILNRISHKNIIKVLDYFTHKENECIAFDFYEKDLLKILMNRNLEINEQLIKSIMKQILEGVNHLHEKKILHRDLKPDNIFIGKDGVVKISDFDLAREYIPDQALSRGVVTIYYRPPEIFYGATKYDYSLDMWSVGCILAELILREPIFKGRSELDVMYKIHEEDNWPGCTSLQNFFTYGDNKPTRSLQDVKYFNLLILKLFAGKINEDCFDLLSHLLVLNPKKRLTAKEALNHKYFDEDINSSVENIQKYLN